ncbi:hypothetical protein [Streptomyces triticirhizae]|uniref:Uncharacterized protein n=1 Tax=Streptomyces triticirhizae TaxID=2483353 RepID=A0A3M2L5G9_9ACTN|nr:hypothetical protein [Streptomyces triticirhizae]RMI29788.1 hypothetical protein EBN88_27150 [Streptomyces triticirhizae]
MSTDGLYYLPEGFREGARGNAETADAAEGAARYLGRVPVNTAGYAGADAFPKALTSTRDAQARGITQAAEGRTHMAQADRTVAATGEGMDTAAAQALSRVTVTTPVDRGVADAI